MFTKILIANRGEIACRVIATAKKMGIKTVAVYSDADKDARFVLLADEAVNIGAPPSRESYLVGEKIIAACKQTGAQALHPGYGFLSENAEFAKRVEEEGIVFIGPKHYSMAAMGDKIESKKLAGAAGVNCIPGVNSAIESAEKAVEIAKGIGYPVIVVAVAPDVVNVLPVAEVMIPPLQSNEPSMASEELSVSVPPAMFNLLTVLAPLSVREPALTVSEFALTAPDNVDMPESTLTEPKVLMLFNTSVLPLKLTAALNVDAFATVRSPATKFRAPSEMMVPTCPAVGV